MNWKPSEFPNDANGDALRRLQRDGDDLTQVRGIDFTVVFPTANTAEQFAEYFRNLGHKVTVENSNCVPELPWDVIVVHCMVPSYEGITVFEESLQRVADTLGGRNDGWGCFAVNDKFIN
jgi:hypothetical protein